MEKNTQENLVKSAKHPVVKHGPLVIIALILLAGVLFWQLQQKKVYIEKAEITAPVVDLSSKAGGKLEEVMVKEGDEVKENQTVARVGDELIKAKTDGVVVKANEDIGKNFNPGEAVVSVVSPDDLRVVGHLDEDKGLTDVKVGQTAEFTADAYGSRKFMGVVDEISDTSRDSDIVFNISDKREKRQFDIKIRYSVAQYPELKNGMSAQAWVYKQ
jgi:multidrug resistance efflux pump